MNRLFKFVEHIGKWRVLVGTRDLNDGCVITDKLADGAVTTPKLEDYAVTVEKLAPESVKYEHLHKTLVDLLLRYYNNLQGQMVKELQTIHNQINELYAMIRSLAQTGAVLSQHYGDDELVGISQKTLTETLREMMARINDIAGDTTGVTFEVTPGFFWDDEATLHIKAATDAIFDYLDIYVDDTKIASFADGSEFEHEHVITDTATVRAVGSVMGVVFDRSKTVVKSDSILSVGSAATWEDIGEHATMPYDLNHPNITQVTVANNGDKIFVAIGTAANIRLRRVTMNGFNVNLEEPTVIGDWLVYESSNTFVPGTYPIVID